MKVNLMLTKILIFLTFKLVMSLLSQFKCESFKYCTIISFMCLQLDLMTKKSIVYPHDFLVFTSHFYNLSPHAYCFLRSSGTCILPCYSTIREVTLASAVSPQNETDFLFYVRQKYKTLLACDKTVMLLLDEIHLKPCFDYKGGNVVGATFNSNDAATSAFTFMISSVFSKYKEVHVLPTSKMSASFLYDVIRRIVLDLENIRFQVICVFSDNNAINGKAMSFFFYTS